MSDHSQDPFFDPFSPEPVSPVPPWGQPSSPDLPPPAAPPPTAAPRPPVAPSVSVRQPPPYARPPASSHKNVAGLSPATVFFGSYVFAGIAALLLATAIAVLVAISDFRARGSTAGPLMVAAATGLVVVAALVVSLGVLDDRGRGWARIATWGVCGLGICAGVAIFVLGPGESVAWFGQLLHVGAVATMIISVASAVLLGLPESHAYFGQGSRPKPAAAPAFPNPAGFSAPPTPYQPPAPTQPSAGSAPPPRMPANDSDYDPFS